jgi:enamine deaminase RidA (YjgF/YER057c/UK114 family)
MRILQPAEWSKPRGFSHGVAVDGPGQWVALAGQTGGDEKGDYQPEMAAQVGTALKRIVKLLGEAGAGPEHIVRLTWYLTSRGELTPRAPALGLPGRKRWDAISRRRRCSISAVSSMSEPKSKSKSLPSSRPPRS